MQIYVLFNIPFLSIHSYIMNGLENTSNNYHQTVYIPNCKGSSNLTTGPILLSQAITYLKLSFAPLVIILPPEPAFMLFTLVMNLL